GDDLDGGVVGTDDARKGEDDGGGPKGKPFACGTDDAGAPQTCNDTLCCANQAFDPFHLTQTSYSCVTANSQCQLATDGIVRCHNANDCSGGQFCCGDFDGTEYKNVGCASSCSRSDAGMDHLRFCIQAKGNAECNPGETCSESGVLPGFFRCSSQ